MSAVPVEHMRLDKWLWCARFFKSRALAASYCEETGLRINGARVEKPHYQVRPGDVLTFVLGPNIRVVRVQGLADRRGPSSVARGLYEELTAAHAG